MTNPDFPVSGQIEELERQLKEALAQRDAAWQEMEDLARFISHDLRAPLRGIDGYSQALEQDYEPILDNLGKAYLNFIRESSRAASQIIDRLLAYTRIPRAALNPQTVDVSALGCQIATRLQASQPERQAMIEIAPDLSMYADPKMIATLLDELLSNAWKFTTRTPEAHIRLACQTEGDQVVWTVRDNGAGFNMAYAQKLFHPFQRLHGAHEYDGVGLGLAICRRIIERHAGSIQAEGEIGKGAVFTFIIPSK
jgi:light-regulated signal transduction histidine kinase (bacteriophytochrome)